MPFWLIVIIGIIGFAIWPILIVLYHVSEEKQFKKEQRSNKADEFLNKINRGK